MKDQNKNKELYIYDSSQIEEMLQILDTVNIRGLKECQKVVVLAAALSHPLRKEKEDGSREQHC